MLTRGVLRFAVVCSLVLSVSQFLYSQANGSFSGTVTDKTGSVISGASVKITSQATGLVRDTKTDDSGHYVIPLLPVSDYTIRAEASGFKATEQKDVRLQVNEQREVDFTLVPASVTENVEVSATEVAVQTTNATLGQVITQEQVADLPLNGRNFVQLATLTPGTTQETNPNSFFNGAPSSEVSARGSFSLSVGGSRAQSTDWLLDNNDNDELTSGGISVLPTIDSIQEFKVLTYNYSAEYGTRAGPTVLVTTKSGSNKFHGNVYEYLRNTKLDAAYYCFVNCGPQSAADFNKKFNLNQFGGSLGGPIQKDKTFFFVNVEAKRQRKGVQFNGTVPTEAEKGVNGQYADFTNDPFLTGFLTNPYAGTSFQCDPSTGNPTAVLAGGFQTAGVNCNKIPITGGPTGSGLVDPTGLAVINLYPVGSNTYTNGVNYTNVPVRRLNEINTTIRMDHNFSAKDQAFARFTYDQANSFVPGGSPTWAELNAFGSNQHISNHARNFVVSETHIFNSNNINQAYAGYNRIFNHIISFGEFGGELCKADSLGIVAADLNSRCPNAPPGLTQTNKDCLSCGLSSFLNTTYWSIGDRGFAPFQGGTNVFTFSDTLDMIRGKHDIRVGMGVRINQMNVMTNGFQDGLYIMGSGFTGDNVADLLIGQPFGSLHDQTFYGATTGRRWKMWRPFVQDDWRVTPNLTLNLGLAWALVSPETEAQGRQANFDWPTKTFFIAGNHPYGAGCTNCVHSDSAVGIQFDKRALEPRIGFAWSPFKDDKTAIRGGYAIYHDSAWSLGAQGLWQNPPYYAEVDNFLFATCPFGNAFAGAAAVNCGLKYGFVQSNLQPITSAPNPDSFTGGLWSQNRDFKQGTVQQFNLNLENQLPGDLVLTTGYAGARSTHILFFGLNLNLNSPSACIGGSNGYFLGCGPGGAPFVAQYQANQFINVQNVSDKGRANYDSLQIKAETKNMRHGLYMLLGYTWSRAFDSALADGDGSFAGAPYWPLPGTKSLDWGLSQIDVNDQFTASVLYELPFGKGKHFGGDWSGVTNAIAGGWQINVIQKVTSGFPIFISDSANSNFSGPGVSGVNFQWNGSSLNRPNQVCDPNSGPHTKAEWFNTSCFVHAPQGELGNAKRAPIYGPRFVNTDFSLFKNFPIRESLALQFRAEFFNLWNHPDFGLTGSSSTLMQDINSPSNFGVINQTVHDPRVMQLALRLDF
jgi:hypothetical protein